MRVGPSDIAGSGLFATEPIAAGTRVSRVGGRLVGSAELYSLIDRAGSAPLGYVDSIVVYDDVHLVLAPSSMNRFGNHSCDPNLGWLDSFTLCAMRDIAAAEELTNDYATSTANPAFLLRCHCGSARCRGMVAGDDWRISELQRRYDGYWVPTLQHRIDEMRRVTYLGIE
ncbi:MAG: SET domain-containing protein-lysine N-methyltransferase [Candidatus Nephthysia bennettiae]|nr:MAG: SET domain-containing protein-lysine N-methyltransferase [Candidatus Dormibacteraeota bacterium]